MTAPHLRARSKKRFQATSPGGKQQIQYKTQIVPTPSCPICGQTLAGIGHFTTAKRLKLNRSKRRIGRPYGGQLCHNCLKKALKQSARTL